MKLKPVANYVTLEKIEQTRKNSGILIPEGSTVDDFKEYVVIGCGPKTEKFFKVKDRVLVREHMVEKYKNSLFCSETAIIGVIE